MTQALSKLVTFRLADDLFAAGIFSVERVLRYEAPRPVPDLPPWIEGVIEYQSRVVPVIDLRRRFELSQAPVRPETRILVLNAGSEWVGALVDAVVEVATVDASRISPPPAFSTRMRVSGRTGAWGSSKRRRRSITGTTRDWYSITPSIHGGRSGTGRGAS